MTFKWLKNYMQETEKPENYAEKTLAAYLLGMKAKGAIQGVLIEVDATCCDAARQLPANQVYHPKEAPRVPLPDCSLGRKCRCIYRPLMTYQEKPE